MAVPSPPSPFICNIRMHAAGTQVHRVHPTAYAANKYHPGGSGNARFSPIQTRAGIAIPTMYGGSSLACAVFETLFHDIDPAEPFKTFRLDKLDLYSYSIVAPNSPFSTGTFFTPDLMKVGCDRRSLIDTPPSTYGQTRQWAVAAHEDNASVDGLLWTSRRHDGEKCFMLFGSRLPEAKIDILRTVQLTKDAAVLNEVHKLATDAGIVFTR